MRRENKRFWETVNRLKSATSRTVACSMHQCSDACELVPAASSSHILHINMCHTSISKIILNTDPPYWAAYLRRDNFLSPPLLAPLLRQYCCQLLQPLQHPSLHQQAQGERSEVFVHHSHYIYVIISGGIIKSEHRRQTQTFSSFAINI